MDTNEDVTLALNKFKLAVVWWILTKSLFTDVVYVFKLAVVWYIETNEDVTLALNSFKLEVVWFKLEVVKLINPNCNEDENTLSPPAKSILDSLLQIPAFQ